MDQPAPSFALMDADGQLVELGQFRGKIVVLNFIYATCPDVCPLHSELIAQVQEMTADAGMEDVVQFISVTTDPVNDTPEVLREYGPVRGLDPANWVFLTARTGDAEDLTRRVAESYGLRFEAGDDGYQLHGVVTQIIDREGRWRANFHGLRAEPLNIVVFLNSLANDWTDHPHPKWWQRLLGLF